MITLDQSEASTPHLVHDGGLLLQTLPELHVEGGQVVVVAGLQVVQHLLQLPLHQDLVRVIGDGLDVAAVTACMTATDSLPGCGPRAGAGAAGRVAGRGSGSQGPPASPWQGGQ